MPVNMPTHGARPRLLRPQLPDPRARERRAVLEGPVLRRARRLRHGRHGQHQLHEHARPSDRARRRRRRRVRPRAARGGARRRPAARCSARSSSSTATGRGSGPTTSASSTASFATAAATRATACRRPRWAIARRGTRPIRFPRARSTTGGIGRFGLVDATDGGESSRYSASLEWQRTNGNASTRLTAYGLEYDLDLFSNFTYFLDDPVNGDQFQQADHRFVSGRARHPPAHRPLGRAARPRTPSACSSGTTTSATSGSITRESASGSTRSGRTRCSRRAPAPSRRTRRNGRRGCRTLAGVRVDGYRFGVDAGDPRERRDRLRRPRQPEGRRGLRAVREDRDLRQRRPGLPQQRRARRDDHGRSRHRRAGPAASRRSRARRAPRSASARCASRTCR